MHQPDSTSNTFTWCVTISWRVYVFNVANSHTERWGDPLSKTISDRSSWKDVGWSQNKSCLGDFPAFISDVQVTSLQGSKLKFLLCNVKHFCNFGHRHLKNLMWFRRFYDGHSLLGVAETTGRIQTSAAAWGVQRLITFIKYYVWSFSFQQAG